MSDYDASRFTVHKGYASVLEESERQTYSLLIDDSRSPLIQALQHLLGVHQQSSDLRVQRADLTGSKGEVSAQRPVARETRC